MYSTLNDIKKLVPEEVLVQLTDDEDLGMINLERIDDAIARADAEADSYCGTRYSVPFSTAPGIIKSISADIAIYNLYSRTVMEIPAIMADRYHKAAKQLEAISKGDISLGVDPAPSSRIDSKAEANRQKETNVFSREDLEGF